MRRIGRIAFRAEEEGVVESSRLALVSKCLQFDGETGRPARGTVSAQTAPTCPSISYPGVSISSTHWARHAGAGNGSAKYCVSRATLPSLNSMTLTV